MEIELKPCPFCGGQPKLDDHGELKIINCRSCGVHKDSVLNTDIIAAWNRRASPRPLTDEQIDAIADPFVTSVGSHWECQPAVPLNEIELLVRSVEAAHGIKEGDK